MCWLLGRMRTWKAWCPNDDHSNFEATDGLKHIHVEGVVLELCVMCLLVVSEDIPAGAVAFNDPFDEQGFCLVHRVACI